MNYTALEELVGEALKQPGSKPAGDWTRYPQSLRQQAIEWAELLCAKHLPINDRKRLRKRRTSLVVTADDSDFLMTANALGQDVMEILDLFAYDTAKAFTQHFYELKGEEIGLRHNVNYEYDFRYYFDDDGRVRLLVPSASTLVPLSTDKPTVEYMAYPPSYDTGVLYMADNTGFTVADAITGETSGATANVDSVASDKFSLSISGRVGNFVVGEEITGDDSGTTEDLTIVPAQFGIIECPFEGNEQWIADAAAGLLLDNIDGDPRGAKLKSEFYSYLGISREAGKR